MSPPPSVSETTEDKRPSAAKKRRSRFPKLRPGKLLVFVASLGPLAWLIWLAVDDNLSANPVEFVNRYLGEWALKFLLLSLTLSPLSRLPGMRKAVSYRRMIGLFAFFYVCIHLSSYVILDQFFDWAAIWKDIIKRVYITLGMGAVLMLIPLAVTSTNKAIKRLGSKRWKALHRLVYPAAILAVVHYIMMVKADLLEPLIYAAILAVLLGLRFNRLSGYFSRYFSKAS